MFDVIICGFGRVGCPLGLALESKGFKVGAIDIDDNIIQFVNKKKMPFYEPGCDFLLSKSKIEVLDGKNLRKYPKSKCYIITVGTPLENHIETNLEYVKSVVNDLLEKNDIKDELIILRSTVAPYTSEYILSYIEEKTNYKLGKDFFLSFCPERIAEGEALKELEKLPQLIGVKDAKSFEKSKKIFESFGVKIFKCSFIEAEIAKLFCNIYRYINFSIPNYFSYIASNFNVDIFELFGKMNKGYPRNDGLKNPGLAGGACLRKDFGMINEFFPQTDLILQAYKINEFMPKFYVDLINDQIKGKNIGILGYTFKSNTDDMRDSLIPKMIRYIERYVPKNIFIHEPNLTINSMIDDQYNNYKFLNLQRSDILNNSDIIFIGINHGRFSDLVPEFFKNKIVIDMWGILSKKLVNYF